MRGADEVLQLALVEREGGFQDRVNYVFEEVAYHERIRCVPHYKVYSAAGLRSMEAQFLAEGYEGLMARHPKGPYKPGRSTLREGYLMKLKQFQDGEAVVLRVEEAMENTNELTTDELGRAKRSHRADGMVGKGMVGTLICHDKKWGEIRVAPGIMDHQMRRLYWEYRSATSGLQLVDKLIGKTIHWRSFGYGAVDAPRFARYYGIKESV